MRRERTVSIDQPFSRNWRGPSIPSSFYERRRLLRSAHAGANSKSLVLDFLLFDRRSVREGWRGRKRASQRLGRTRTIPFRGVRLRMHLAMSISRCRPTRARRSPCATRQGWACRRARCRGGRSSMGISMRKHERGGRTGYTSHCCAEQRRCVLNSG